MPCSLLNYAYKPRLEKKAGIWNYCFLGLENAMQLELCGVICIFKLIGLSWGEAATLKENVCGRQLHFCYLTLEVRLNHLGNRNIPWCPTKINQCSVNFGYFLQAACSRILISLKTSRIKWIMNRVKTTWLWTIHKQMLLTPALFLWEDISSGRKIVQDLDYSDILQPYG